MHPVRCGVASGLKGNADGANPIPLGRDQGKLSRGLLGGTPMVRRGRHGVWISILIASLLLAIVATAGIHLALKPRGPDRRQDGFLAYGQISVAIFGDDVNTPQTKRCIANSVQAGIDVRQGTPVISSLDGRAVGGGDLSTGELKQELT